MQLKCVDTPELLETVAQWLADKQNHQWLDFGNGVQAPSALSLKLMTQRGVNVLRVYTADDDVTPIGVVGLSNVDRHAGTATVWAVLGRKRYGGYTDRAVKGLLTIAFTELGLQSVNAWTVETNIPSIRCMERLGFRPVGRLRQCHRIDGRVFDRLLYDLLASEHTEP
jgi:RimJ/RimL family protein N-acetyltransferase